MRLFSARSGDDEHMHLFEIAYWIAAGILPEPGDRLDRDAIVELRGAQWTPGLWLSAEEISTLLPGVPIDEYMHFREICGLQTPEEIRAERQSRKSYMPGLRQAALTDPEIAQSLRESDERERNELEAARELEAFNAPLTRAVERAKLDILQALIEGKLTGTGLLEVAVEGDEEDEWRTLDFEEIPKEKWTLAGVDFENSNLEVGGAIYLAVTVPIEDCLRVFPHPKTEPVRVSGFLHGSTFVLDDESENRVGTAPSKRRGRPAKADGYGPIAVQNAMGLLLKAGKLPRKKEAVTAAAQEWYLTHFNQSLPRSTAQRYLAPIFADMPETDEGTPEIP